MIKEKEQKMGGFQWSLVKEMFINSLPLAFGSLLSVLIGFIDALYLSNFSIDAFKALSLVIPVMGIVGSIGIGVGTALVNSLANFEKEGKKEAVYFSIFSLSFICYVITALTAFWGHQHFAAFNDLFIAEHTEILQHFSAYWYAVIPLYALILFLNIVTQYLSYRNNNGQIIRILLIIVILNLVLNPILIFYLEMGVVGAALASIISMFCGNLYFALNENRLNKIVRILSNSAEHIKGIKDIIFAQLKVALSVFLAIATFAAGSIFFNQLAIKQGADFLAIIGLIEQLKLLMIFPTRGVTGAFLIMFEKSVADKKHFEYWNLYWAGTIIIGLFCVGEALGFVLFSDQLLAIFNIDVPESKVTFQVLLYSLCLYFLSHIFPRASQAGFIPLGKSYLLFLQSLFSILIGYGFTYYLVTNFGKEYFIDGQTIGVAITAVVFLMLFRSLLNKRISTDSSLSVASVAADKTKNSLD